MFNRIKSNYNIITQKFKRKTTRFDRSIGHWMCVNTWAIKSILKGIPSADTWLQYLCRDWCHEHISKRAVIFQLQDCKIDPTFFHHVNFLLISVWMYVWKHVNTVRWLKSRWLEKHCMALVNVFEDVMFWHLIVNIHPFDEEREVQLPVSYRFFIWFNSVWHLYGDNWVQILVYTSIT